MIVAYDCFARQGLERTTVGNGMGKQDCYWCGQKPKRLYRYADERHNIFNSHLDKHVFCGLECFRTYNS